MSPHRPASKGLGTVTPGSLFGAQRWQGLPSAPGPLPKLNCGDGRVPLPSSTLFTCCLWNLGAVSSLSSPIYDPSLDQVLLSKCLVHPSFCVSHWRDLAADLHVLIFHLPASTSCPWPTLVIVLPSQNFSPSQWLDFTCSQAFAVPQRPKPALKTAQAPFSLLFFMPTVF